MYLVDVGGLTQTIFVIECPTLGDALAAGKIDQVQLALGYNGYSTAQGGRERGGQEI